MRRRSPPYYNGIMHHRVWQGVSARWFVMKISPENWYLRAETTMNWWRGGRVTDRVTESSHSWLCPTITGSIASSRLTLGKPRPTLRQMNFGRFVGLGYNITTQILPARSGPQWRLEMNCRYQIKLFNTLKLSAQSPGLRRSEGKNQSVISWEELQYQTALDYVTDSQTLNFVKFVVEKSFLSLDPEKKECLKDVNQWRWSITVKDGLACNCSLFTFEPSGLR